MGPRATGAGTGQATVVATNGAVVDFSLSEIGNVILPCNMSGDSSGNLSAILQILKTKIFQNVFTEVSVFHQNLLVSYFLC